ncbi:MAG: ABC transporter permease [Verrucomicrobiota bacterium]
MKQFLPVFKKELFGYFRSPVGYVILIAFHLLTLGLAFYANFYESRQANLSVLFRFLPWILLVFISATGMRLWSEEKRSGSIELLFTLPISVASAVLAKYLAALAFVAIALLLTFSLAFTTAYLGNPDWGVMLSGYLGSLLLSAAFLGISSLCSSATKNQVIAFVASIAACFAITIGGAQGLIDYIDDFAPTALIDFLTNLSFLINYQTLTIGLIELGAVSLFAFFTIAALAINIVILKK